MSLLVEREEDLATLEEVVAFIDSCDTDITSFGDITSSESENDDSPYSIEDVEAVLLDSLDGALEDASFLATKEPEPPVSKVSARKKRKKAPGASTRLQRRKKAEILGLRAQRQELEGKLEQLKQFKHASSWLALATTQYEERLKSEMVNQQLRAVLAEHLKMNHAFREVFQKQASLQNLDCIFGRQHYRTTNQSLGGADASLALIDDLETRVASLYLDSEAVLRCKHPLTLLHDKQNQHHGRVFEVNGTLSLPCSMEEASGIIWREAITIHTYSDKSYHFVRQRVPSSVERNFTMTLQNASNVKEINGLTFVRKIEEPNRVVLVEVGLILLPTEGLQFRTQRWTVITRSEDAAQSKSMVRSLLQFHAEYPEGFTPTREDLQSAEEFVLETFGRRLQKCIREQESLFCREAERVRVATAESNHQ